MVKGTQVGCQLETWGTTRTTTDAQRD